LYPCFVGVPDDCFTVDEQSAFFQFRFGVNDQTFTIWIFLTDKCVTTAHSSKPSTWPLLCSKLGNEQGKVGIDDVSKHFIQLVAHFSHNVIHMV
jgi:hypothetical protein